MKYWRKILFVGIILLVLLFVCLHIYVNLEGKVLLVAKLQETFKRKAKIGSLTTAFPTTVHVRNIEVEGIFRIDEVIAAGGLFDIFRTSFRLSTLKIIHPVVTIEKGLMQTSWKDSSVPFPPLPVPGFISTDLNSEREADNKVTTPNLNPIDIFKDKFLFPRFYINNLTISEGILNFIDRTVGDSGSLIKIEHLNMKVENLNFATLGSKITSFQLEGKIPWKKKQKDGRIMLKGWIDMGPKNMDGRFELKDVDATHLAAYYQNIIPNKKLLSARLNFTADLKAENNNLIAKCRLEFSNLVYEESQPSEGKTQVSDILPSILNIFSDASGNIVLNFTINTRLDKPRIDLVSLKGSIGHAVVENVASQQPEGVIEKVKGTVEEFKELGKSLKYIFKKKEAQEE